jgi:hypothetical protein
VLTYPAVPMKMLMNEKLSMPAGMAAAMDTGEYQVKNILSIK